MGELIGRVNPSLTVLTPDVGNEVIDIFQSPPIAQAWLNDRELDKRTRLLESSHVAEIFKQVVEDSPKDTTFYYSDAVGHYTDGVRPGYRIVSSDSLSTRTVTLSAGDGVLEATRAESLDNFISYSYDGPRFKKPLEDNNDIKRLLEYLQKAGIK